MRRLWWLVPALAVLGGAVIGLLRSLAPRPLTQQAYVWQRSWNDSVREAVRTQRDAFAEFAVLGAEVAWRRGAPEAMRVAVDYEALEAARRPLGWVLRVGPYGGPFQSDDAAARCLGELATEAVREGRSHGLELAELQIDFDCADAKLEGYAVWLQALKRAVPGLPIVFTALPSWLRQPAFPRLLEAADGYVLQVHSLTRPKSLEDAFSLCDPRAAQKAVERAAGFGKPFRVALPTYGYRLAFDTRGQFAGLSAEGPAREWPSGYEVREVRADATSLAALVREWEARRPSLLRGVLWYRLPVAGDRLNWPKETLAEVMRGRVPTSGGRFEVREAEPGLVEVDLVNTGGTALSGPLRAVLDWSEARLVAADGLGGASLQELQPRQVALAIGRDFSSLDPGRRRTVGWLRLDRPCPVRVSTKEGL